MATAEEAGGRRPSWLHLPQALTSISHVPREEGEGEREREKEILLLQATCRKPTSTCSEGQLQSCVVRTRSKEVGSLRLRSILGEALRVLRGSVGT